MVLELAVIKLGDLPQSLEQSIRTIKDSETLRAVHFAFVEEHSLESSQNRIKRILIGGDN